MILSAPRHNALAKRRSLPGEGAAGKMHSPAINVVPNDAIYLPYTVRFQCTILICMQNRVWLLEPTVGTPGKLEHCNRVNTSAGLDLPKVL